MNDDEHDEPRKTSPLSPEKLSKAPSWVMLGFGLGAAFVWNFKSASVSPAPAVTLKEWPQAVRVTPSPLTTIEAVFSEWGQYAVWDGNVTEVAMWRAESGGFSEYYEVRRFDETLYFRSLSKLTRLIVRHGTPLPKSPLQFTETEEQYREWLAHGRVERSDDSPRSPRGMAAPDQVRLPTPSPRPVPTPPFDSALLVVEKPKLELPPKN